MNTCFHCNVRHSINRDIFRYAAVLTIGGIFLAGCREQPTDSLPQVATPGADTFSVAFYNVANLFDYEFDGNEYLEYRPNATNWNREMYERKLDNIASVLAAINAPIISLCEVEDRDALEALYQALKAKGVRYRFRAIVDTPAAANTCPAVLSRFPIVRYAAHTVALPEGLPTRAILEADIAINGTVLKLFVNHWPSKRHPESYRLTAAQTLAGKLSLLPRGADYLIIGDLNSDYDEFSTFTTFGHNDTRGLTGINHGLGTIRNVTTATSRPRTEREMMTAPFPSHYDLWLDCAEASRMSFFFQGNRQTPDHILLPPALYDSAGISYVDNSFTAFTWGGRLLSYGQPSGWKIRNQGKKKFHVGEGYSDHLPVVARFTRGPFRFTASAGNDIVLSDDTLHADGWFEYHTNEWVACGATVRVARDTLDPKSGRYSLHVVAPVQKKNATVVRTIVRSEQRNKNGVVDFYLRGSCSICFRTRAAGEKWRYHNIAKGTVAGSAKYVPVNFPAWHPVSLTPASPARETLELELRTGKDAALDLWIDR